MQKQCFPTTTMIKQQGQQRNCFAVGKGCPLREPQRCKKICQARRARTLLPLQHRRNPCEEVSPNGVSSTNVVVFCWVLDFGWLRVQRSLGLHVKIVETCAVRHLPGPETQSVPALSRSQRFVAPKAEQLWRETGGLFRKLKKTNPRRWPGSKIPRSVEVQRSSTSCARSLGYCVHGPRSLYRGNQRKRSGRYW